MYNSPNSRINAESSMPDRAEITPKLLKWARESAKIDVETASARAGVTAERLLEWEAGTALPTIRQAQTLARAYKRPFALLFLSDIPRDFKPLQDFRRKGAKPLGTGSVFIIREIQQRQAWISELNQEDNEPRASFVGRFSLKDDPVAVADDILRTFGINPSNYTAASPMKEWIDRAESNGIFISRTSFIHSHLVLRSEEIQGFAIADPYAPFVFINSEDYDAPQLFTLLHEIAHLWIAASGISNHIEPEVEPSDNQHPVELFCNEVAAHALIPAKILDRMPTETFTSAAMVYRQARNLGVSSFALLVRAYKAKRISLNHYRELKVHADAAYQAYLKQEEEKKARQKNAEKSGGPNYYVLQINRNSRLFTQTVLQAFHEGSIAPTQATHLLNVKVSNFPKLEAQLYK